MPRSGSFSGPAEFGVVSGTEEKSFDFRQLEDPGMVILKFGRRGSPHERLFRITGNYQYIYWVSGVVSRKLGQKCVVDLEKVTRVLTGQKTYAFQRWTHLYGFAEDKSLSLVYIDSNGKERSLDIILATDEQFRFWFDGINYLVKKIKDRRARMSIDDLRLEAQWKLADADCSGTLSLSEVVKLISALNINMPTKTVMKYFRIIDVDGSNALTLDEFVELMSLLLVRSELSFVWKSLVRGPKLTLDVLPFNIHASDVDNKKLTISLDDLIKFWETVQQEPITQLEMVTALCDATGIQDQTVWEISPITFATWTKLMSHGINDIFNPAKLGVYQDMTRPLSQYFIATSNHTYLEGDQSSSKPSINRYVNDLLAGCRAVELDCMDGDLNDPIVAHHNSILPSVNKIYFRDVIRTIEQYSFVSSSYPVIVMIENRCSLEQQQAMAKIIKDTFKEKLARPGDYPDGYLPSPEDLKMKIIIMGKRLASSWVNYQEDDDSDDDEYEEESLSSRGRFSRKSLPQSPVSKSKKASRIHPDLSAITFLGTGNVKQFTEETYWNTPCDKASSYSETKTEKFVFEKSTLQKWLKHNERHISRVYPNISRTDCSNYDPAGAWASGSQLVSLNYQSQGLPTYINFGRFRENGCCGYVVKPDYMLRPSPSLDATPQKFTVNVLSGQQFPKPLNSTTTIDPYVVVHINGHPLDTTELRTKAVVDNSFNPLWNEVLTFKVQYPELAIVTFVVVNEKNGDFIAFNSLPLTCLRPGIRVAPLCDKAGKRDQEFAFATLVLRSDITSA